MSAYCNHCGTELPDSAAFCLKCGKSVGSRPAPSPAERPKHENGRRASTPTGKAIKIGIAAALLLIAAIAFWPRNYVGRFVPRPGTNFALDNKTGRSCRMSGEKGALPPPTPLTLPPGYVPDAPPTNPIPLCSEIVDAETRREEVMARFAASGLLVLFGIYITIRHWKKKRNP